MEPPSSTLCSSSSHPPTGTLDAAEAVPLRIAADRPVVFDLSTFVNDKTLPIVDPLQVSRLLTARNFQRHSGPLLESLSLQQQSYGCFKLTAESGTYPVTAYSAFLMGLLFVQHLNYTQFSCSRADLGFGTAYVQAHRVLCCTASTPISPEDIDQYPSFAASSDPARRRRPAVLWAAATAGNPGVHRPSSSGI